jgi:hypothetical protein
MQSSVSVELLTRDGRESYNSRMEDRLWRSMAAHRAK